VLAKNCESEEYTKLVTALCKENQVPLLLVDSREKLGELVGLVKTDKEGAPRGKTVKCSVAVVTEWGEETREYHALKEYLNVSE
jgi:small subunit ribosomal protein S12e